MKRGKGIWKRNMDNILMKRSIKRFAPKNGNYVQKGNHNPPVIEKDCFELGQYSTFPNRRETANSIRLLSL